MSKKNTTHTHLVAIDVGFGGLKYMSDYKPTPNMIPSAVVKGQPRMKPMWHSETINENEIVVSTEDGTHLVGNNALYQPEIGGDLARTTFQDRASDNKSRVLFHTGIGLSLPDESGDYEVFITTGLPNEDYELKMVREGLKEFLSEDFTVEFHLHDQDSIKKNIKVKGVEVIRQPEGTMIQNQFKLDSENLFAPSEDSAEYVGVIDFGHLTTDIALFNQGQIIEDRKLNRSSIGATASYEDIQFAIMDKFANEGYRFKPSTADLDDAVKNKYVKYQGKEFDVTAEVEEVAYEKAGFIAIQIQNAWKNEINRLDLMVGAGGATALYAKHLNSHFVEKNIPAIIVQENAEFSNLLGFYLYALMEVVDLIGLDNKEAYDTYAKQIERLVTQ